MGRLQEERNLWQVSTYQYDVNSRLTHMTSHLGVTQYSYDAGDRVTQVEDPLGNRTTFAYDINYGHRTSVSLPLGAGNKLVQQDTYYQLSDGRLTNRLKQRTDTKTIGTTTSQVWQATYTYDVVGMIRTFKDSTPQNHIYVYDQAYRLVEAKGTSANYNHPDSYYAYDSAGNRTSVGNDKTGGVISQYQSNGYKGSITHTVDVANRLQQVDEVASNPVKKVFTYEANGNVQLEDWQRTGYAPACGTGWANRLVYTYYDDANRLAARQEIDWTRLANFENWTFYKYDGDGRRLVQMYQQTDRDSECKFSPVWTERTSYEYANGEVLNERTVGGVPVWYIRGPQGELLYTLHWRNNELRPDALVRDHLGSIRMVVDYQGNVANRYDYDAYGNLTQNSTKLRNSYTFTGYGLDDRTGQYYASARYYRPDVGRFLTQDTYKGNVWEPWTQNLYTYVYNNPVNYIDPTGHSGESMLQKTVATIFAVLNYVTATDNSVDFVETVMDLRDLQQAPSLPGVVAVAADALTLLAPGTQAKVDGPTSAKRPPNPYGKTGSPAHQAKVQDVAADIASRGLEPEFEYLVKTPNGHKPYRYADVVAKDAHGNVVEIHQVGRVTKSGWAVSRGLKAMRDIQEAKGIYVRFHEYQW